MGDLKQLEEILTTTPSLKGVSFLTQFQHNLSKNKISLQQLFQSLIKLKSVDYNPRLLPLLLTFSPSYKAAKAHDNEFLYVHSVGDSIRKKDEEFCNKCIHYALSELKKHNMSLNSPVVSLVMDMCMALSGIHDIYGFSYTKNLIELEIGGGISLESLEVFDDSPEEMKENKQGYFPSIILTRILKMMIVFFNKDSIKSMLETLTQKDSYNDYDLEILWLNHEKELFELGQKNTEGLFIGLNKFLIEKRIITKSFPLKMTHQKVNFPEVVD
jgi:hypothetical protein